MVNMTAKAVFKCHPSSHHFDERHIRLTEPVKIGRSVAKARPALDNGIFDCKVLSRNHALIWYDSDSSKFFLQDTKSSNGTFVNNNRLSRGSEESPAHEICSGDIIQFGVDVMENSRRGVVTHGCIVAQLSLFHQDGTEATRSDSSPPGGPGFPNQSTGNNNVPSQELYQLSHYLKEALHREQMLEQKLVALQRLVSSTQEATESSWQALIDEDRLLSRLEVVENQLRAYSKANTEESIRKELIALQEDKSTYEKTVKESLKKALEEKLEACRKVADTERMLSNSEDECAHVREELEGVKREQDLLLEKYSQLEKDSQELLQKMGDADRAHEDELDRMQAEQRELVDRIGELQKNETTLGIRAEELQAENDFIKEQLLATKERLEETQEALKLAGSMDIRTADEGSEEVTKCAVDPSSMKEEAKKDTSLKDNNPGRGEDEVKLHQSSLITNGDDRTPTRESGVRVESLWRDAVSNDLNGRVSEMTAGGTLQPLKSLRSSAEETVMGEVKRYRHELEEARRRQEENERAKQNLEREVSEAHRKAERHKEEMNTMERRLQEAEENARAAAEKAVSDLRERLSASSSDCAQDADSDTSSTQTLIDEPVVLAREEERQQAVAISGDLSSTLTLSWPSSRIPEDKRKAGLHNHVQDNNSSPSDDVDAALLEIDNLKDELHTMRSKYFLLEAENDAFSKQLDTAHQETRVTTERTAVLEERLKQEAAVMERQSQDIDSLKQKLVEGKNAASHTHRELEQCQGHIASLSEDLAKEKDLRQRIEMELKQITSLQQELITERNEKERLIESTKELQLRIDGLGEALKKKEVKQNKKDDKGPPAESGHRQTSLAIPDAEFQSIRREKTAMSQEIERLQSLLQEAEVENRKLSDCRDSLDQEIGDLRRKNDDLQKLTTKSKAALQMPSTQPGGDHEELDGLRQRLETVTAELKEAKANNSMAQMKWLPVCVIGIAIIATVCQSLLAMWVDV